MAGEANLSGVIVNAMAVLIATGVIQGCPILSVREGRSLTSDRLLQHKCRECTDQNALLLCAIYVKLLLWTAEQLKSGQRNTIPADLMAVLDHFQVQHDAWWDTVEKFQKTFGQAVGRADTLTAVAERMGLKHMKGITACRATFT